MKKAFDQNVSRTRPRLRLGSFVSEETAENTDETNAAAADVVEDRGQEVIVRAEPVSAPEMSASPLDIEPAAAPVLLEPAAAVPKANPVGTAPAVNEPVVSRAVPVAQHPVVPPAPPVAQAVAPAELDPHVRRERLKERLKAVRENPRPEPLPPTVAEAGVMAVERISTLQVELTRVKTLNLALTQDLEGARRQSERATEEARLRMDEAQRLASQLEARAKLLADLERELSSLEGERDESLLALQESRRATEAVVKEREALQDQVAERDRSLAESLSEEERLAGELESAREETESLRRALQAMQTERDTLARQVADLTTERAELLEARKALESVHRALSQAAAR